MPTGASSTRRTVSTSICNKCGVITTGPDKVIQMKGRLHVKVCKGKMDIPVGMADDLIVMRNESLKQPRPIIYIENPQRAYLE